MSWHAGLPWDAIRAYYRMIRAALFSKPRPTGRYAVIEASSTSIIPTLGEVYFAPNWEQSYHKRGEALNLARVYWEPRSETWRQTHVRGWIHDDGTLWLRAHDELEPTEYPRKHILGDTFSIGTGMTELKSVLEEAGVPFEMWEYDGSESIKRG